MSENLGKEFEECKYCGKNSNEIKIIKTTRFGKEESLCKNHYYQKVNNGEIKDKNILRNKRIGLIKQNNYGSTMRLLEYTSTRDIRVIFDSGEIVSSQWSHFVSGRIKSVYDKSVFNFGYIGEGNYKPSLNEQPTVQYKYWKRMLQRCYSEKYHEKEPTYKDCGVCDEWLNFQKFAEWYNENYYEINGERIELDKDILIKGNKTYSPETCIFTPKRINSLFIKNKSRRGNLPIGVYEEKGKYKSNIKINDKRSNSFDNTLDAFIYYKEAKENLIKQIAEEYKNKIPKKLYNAMCKYEVEITD